MEATLYTLLTSLTGWVQQHPLMSGILVFLVALLESLVIIGMPMPGAALMVGIGALIAFDALELWSTLLWAIAGAICGDGISFWVGYRYREQLRCMWPFSRYTRLFDRGEAFFARHGGKSIVFGRFVGPVRAIIPTVAGMMKMSPRRYLTINILSAFAWAPAYILPGVIFGASLELASEVAMRLVMSLSLLVLLLLTMRWLLRRVFEYLQPRTDQIITSTIQWSRKHPLLGRVTAALVDPRQPESPALVVLALLLLIAGFSLFALLQQVSGETPLFAIDTTLHQLMQGLHTSWMDSLMVAITMLGDKLVYGGIALALLLWLAYKRDLTAILHLLAAIGFGAIASRILKVALQVPRPTGIESGFSFPSAHATMSMVVYGFIAVLVAREVQPARRHWIYVSSGILIIAIAISRVYLGVHWLSDVAAGVMLGLIWTTLIGIAYRRHYSPPLSARSLIAVLLLSGTAVAGAHLTLNHAEELQHYTPPRTIQSLPQQVWWQDTWSTLPALRNDITQRNNHPFNLQWAASRAELEAQLGQHGWRTPTEPSLRNLLQWLNPEPDIDNVPVLPHTHTGRQQEIILIHSSDQAQHRWVLRLWPSQFVLQPGNTPLWIGNVSELSVTHSMGLFAYAVTGQDFNTPLQLLQQQLTGWRYEMRTRKIEEAGKQLWNGEVLLVEQIQDTGRQ